MKLPMPCLTALVVCLALLGACTAKAPYDVRKRSSAQEHFEVADNFESVHANIMKKLDECTSARTEGKLNTLAGSSRITVGNISMLVEITRVDDALSRVDVYAMSRGSRMKIPEYGANGKAGCP